jgi:hypothetical protein
LHSTKWSSGKTKEGWKSLSHKKSLIQDSEGNKENRYPAPDSNKTRINDVRKPNNAHKSTLKEEILPEIT